jgi:hypothetical protein
VRPRQQQRRRQLAVETRSSSSPHASLAAADVFMDSIAAIAYKPTSSSTTTSTMTG